MGQPPQNSQGDQPYYSLTTMQVLDPAQELDLQSQPWMMATMIEDDDLMFGGKPLSTWYEEDRRRYSLGEESAPSPGFEEEEERRGRQRVSTYLPTYSCAVTPSDLLPCHPRRAGQVANTARQDRPHYHMPSSHTHHHHHQQQQKKSGKTASDEKKQ